MGSMLQFSIFLSIGWLIRGAVTHPRQVEDKILNNKKSNQNGSAVGDFYFDEQKANDDNVKTGKAISQSAWSKEDKEQTQTVENKAGTQFSNEFSLKNALSYFLNMLHELKKDILGIKEMTNLKSTKDLTYSHENSEDKAKQNKMGENNDTPKPHISPRFEKENQKHNSNYVIDYYKNNGNEFVDDDLETSNDENDDSSHNMNEENSVQEISKIKHNACISDCSNIKRKPDKYASEAEEITAIPTSQTKIPKEIHMEFFNKDDEKDDFKDSITKPSTVKQNYSKISEEETENTPSSKTGKYLKKNNDNSNNLNEKNEPTNRLLKSAEYVTSRHLQDEKFKKEPSKRPNQNNNNKLPKMASSLSDSRSSGKYSKNKAVLDNKSGILGQSTTLFSQSSNDVIYPENIENKPYSYEMSKKLTYKKQEDQITSQKPEDQGEALKNTNKANEYSTVSLQSHEIESEIPNHEMSTDIEIKGSPKEYKGKRLNVHSSHTTTAYIENEPNVKSDGKQTSNSFDTGITTSPTISGNNMITENLNKDLSDNLHGKKGTSENEKSNHSQRDRNDSETQRFSKTEQAKPQNLNISEPEKSLKNIKLSDTNEENNHKESDNLASMTTNDLPSPKSSNREIQNHDVQGSDKPQEAQKNKESLNKKDGQRDISIDEEYEEDNEDFEISDEFTDEENGDIEIDEDFNENEEDELITNNRNEENNDEMNPGNTEDVLRNESQISQHTGYVLEEKSQEQYNTFLEYFYKHSNNTFFKSLKNQLNNLSQ